VEIRNPKKPADDAHQQRGDEEIVMTANLKDARQLAAVAAKEDRARDAAQAMRDYEAERLALLVNTARLRALRLAKEAGNAHETKAQRPAKKIARRPAA
jgi:hypothetical protein